MAQIVAGAGSSHSPQLSSTTDWWTDHAKRDARNPFLIGRDGEVHTYDELLAHPEWAVPAELLTPKAWQAAYDRGQKAVDQLRAELGAAKLDAVIVVGDDQEEMFRNDGMPTFAVYYGDTVIDYPLSEEEMSSLPVGIQAAEWAAHGLEREDYPVPAKLGRHIIEELVLEEFDVTSLSVQPQQRTIGHAFTFVRRRLMGEQVTPILPVAINAYNPPNQPSARRCYLFGRALRRAVESYPEELRVGVVASGGLSHFVVDEAFDQRIISALKNKDADSLMTLPRKYLRSGTSETLNWVAAAGALEHLSADIIDYIPAYRSPAGTGVGMTFAFWR